MVKRHRCPLCSTPEHLPGVWGCECQYDRRAEFDAALEARTAAEKLRAVTERHEARFRGDLPVRYRAYLDQEYPTVVAAANIPVMLALANLGPGAFVYLWGEGGRGKTHLAVQAAYARIVGGVSARFASETDFVDEEQKRARGETFRDFITPDVLVLDDLGRRRVNDFASERLYVLLEKRWSECRLTYITSNLSPEDAAARLCADPVMSSALVSRLKSGHVFEFAGPFNGRAGSAL